MKFAERHQIVMAEVLKSEAIKYISASTEAVLSTHQGDDGEIDDQGRYVSGKRREHNATQYPSRPPLGSELNCWSHRDNTE
ncbi:hypothetical protein Plhal304r1_c035g0109091 [Plasmopara halstedii]